MTTIISGKEPKVERQTFDISVGRENRNFSDIGLRRSYNIPLEAECTITPIDGLDADRRFYSWFEVTL